MDTAEPLTITNLWKRYGRLEVLRGLDLTLLPGAVYGLVGLNGSGKTTTLECALGLLRPRRGSIAVLGRPPRRLWETRGRVGVLFDTPCLHPNLTVRQVLRHARMMCGDRSRPPEELEQLLGLERYRRVKIRKLSLGNRRRAAIAHALVGRPALVVLDEPFSGLDAGGIDDLLAIIQNENRARGTTFLLASHQLPYLERICTHVGILHAGRIARGGTVRELLAGRTARLWLRADSIERARTILTARPDVRSVGERPDGRLVLECAEANPASINRTLVEGGVSVSELVSTPPSIEALFREIVGEGP